MLQPGCAPWRIQCRDGRDLNMKKTVTLTKLAAWQTVNVMARPSLLLLKRIVQ
jgi:hypothetical protein